MPKSRRDRIHEATRQEIKTLAWSQIARSGAENLSLRQIAKVMGLTPPALYRYFTSRDDLVTELILEAYSSLTAEMQASLMETPGANARERMFKMAIAYRDWAIRRPQRYSMIFGTPIPGYTAPEDVTLPAARQALVGLIHSIADAFSEQASQSNRRDLNLPPDLDVRLAGLLQEIQMEAGPGVPYLALVTWAKVHGLVSLEIYGHWGPVLGDAESFYRHTIQVFLDRVVFPQE